MESKKLFFYELEGRGYTFQNKNWDEAKHGFEDDMLNMAWEMWSSGQVAKAQAVPEGFVLVSSRDLLDLTVMINQIDLLTIGKRPAEVSYHMVSVGTRIQEIIEAQEPTSD